LVIEQLNALAGDPFGDKVRGAVAAASVAASMDKAKRD
jgi:hypothetical protein